MIDTDKKDLLNMLKQAMKRIETETEWLSDSYPARFIVARYEWTIEIENEMNRIESNMKKEERRLTEWKR